MFLAILIVCDMLLHVTDRNCLFYRIWFLSKFLKKRALKYSPNNDSPSDNAGNQKC